MQQYDNWTNALKRKINKNIKENVLFVCIGTNRNISDSVGPLVGTYLKKRIGTSKVLGDIENNIRNKKDLINYYNQIKDKFVVAIDAAILPENINETIFITEKPIIMGLALNKNKGKIGDIGIKIGIENLQIEDRKYINNLAKFVSNGIIKSIFSDDR